MFRPLCRAIPDSQGTLNGLFRSCKSKSFHASTKNHASADPQAIAEAFLSKFAKGQTFVRTQYLDANQARLFSLTLNRPHLWSGSTSSVQSLEEMEPLEGTPLPPGYHLAYFTPAQLPGILGIDGTDASFNPEVPFTRRMWAGGSVAWPGADPNQGEGHFLKVGDHATETTKVLSCEAKTIKKTGESMLVVGVEKSFTDSKDNLCVVDKRNWVFRTALDPSKPAKIPTKPKELSQAELDEQGQGKVVKAFKRDNVILFRFSALTFNGHRIHYDKPWARDVEGHRDVVVHGPMNLVSMLDMWRDQALDQGRGSARDNVIYPKQIDYRATSPVYAGEGYRIMMNEDAIDKKQAEMLIVSDDGTTCMKGTIVDW